MKLSLFLTVVAPCVAVARGAGSSTKGSKKDSCINNSNATISNLVIEDTLFFDDGTQSIGVSDMLSGLVLSSTDGLRIVAQEADAGSRRQLQIPAINPGGLVRFGTSDGSALGASALTDNTPGGLFAMDPVGLRLFTPLGDPGSLIFGEGLGECRITPDPTNGLGLYDPNGVRIVTGEGAQLVFGPNDECRITVNPINSDLPRGLMLEDPFGIRLVDPTDNSAGKLLFGPTDDCSISATSGVGLIIEDPDGFLFQNALVQGGALVSVDGSVEAVDFTLVSSRRYKTNIRDIPNAMSKLLQLRGVYFDWKQEKGGRADLGLIAEEVAVVFPEIVSFEEKRNELGETEKIAKGVKYANLVAVTIEAIKEQHEEIQELHEKFAKQQEHIAKQEKLVETLEEEMKRLREQVLGMAE